MASKKVMDYEDQNIDASNFYQMPPNMLSHSLDSSKLKSHCRDDDEIEQMAELIMSQNQHLLEGDLDFIKLQLKEQLKASESEEKVLPNGNTPAYACGPLKKERYINPKIEKELVEFKQEIEDKFQESQVNRTYVFPRAPEQQKMTIDDQIQLKQKLNKINEDTTESVNIKTEELRKSESQESVIIMDKRTQKIDIVRKSNLVQQKDQTPMEMGVDQRKLVNRSLVLQSTSPTPKVDVKNVPNRNLQINTKIRPQNQANPKGSQTSSHATELAIKKIQRIQSSRKSGEPSSIFSQAAQNQNKPSSLSSNAPLPNAPPPQLPNRVLKSQQKYPKPNGPRGTTTTRNRNYGNTQQIIFSQQNPSVNMNINLRKRQNGGTNNSIQFSGHGPIAFNGNIFNQQSEQISSSINQISPKNILSSESTQAPIRQKVVNQNFNRYIRSNYNQSTSTTQQHINIPLGRGKMIHMQSRNSSQMDHADQFSPNDRPIKKTRLASAINYSKGPQQKFTASVHFGQGALKNLARKGGINSGRSQSKNGRNINIHTQDMTNKQTIISPTAQQPAIRQTFQVPRPNRNIIGKSQNKTRRVTLDRKLLQSQDFGANQQALGAQMHPNSIIPPQLIAGPTLIPKRQGRKTERNKHFMAMSQDFQGGYPAAAAARKQQPTQESQYLRADRQRVSSQGLNQKYNMYQNSSKKIPGSKKIVGNTQISQQNNYIYKAQNLNIYFDATNGAAINN